MHLFAVGALVRWRVGRGVACLIAVAMAAGCASTKISESGMDQLMFPK